MDLQNVEEFHCAVCFELFGEGTKCPRILLCGHSFCHSCLQNLLVNSPVCPNCKEGIQFPQVDSIPINYIVKSFVARMFCKTPEVSAEQNSPTMLNVDLQGMQISYKEDSSIISEKDTSSPGLPSEGYCEEHDYYMNLRCMDCESWVCGVCVALNHKPCRTLLVVEALKEMKLKISKKIEIEIEEQNFQNGCVDKLIEDLQTKRLILKQKIKQIQIDLRSKIEELKLLGKSIEELQLIKSERKKHCEKLSLLETSVEETTNNDQFRKASNKLNEFLTRAQNLMDELTIPRSSHCHLSLEILREWCHEGSVYAFRCQNGRNQYGKVIVKGNRLWVHCFQPQKANGKSVILSFRELLLNFSGSLELPRRGFLQVDDGTSNLCDVVIATDAPTPRALNFLLLCSGVKGRSYEGSGFYFYAGLEDWILTAIRGRAVVKGIRDEGVYEAPRKEGSVCGWKTKYANSLSRFAIFMEDDPSVKLKTKFGIVEEGFDVCQRIRKERKDSRIKNCGLVI